MRKIGQFEIITAVIMIVTSLVGPVLAEISWLGDVVPSDPSTWDSGTIGYIGDTGNGTMGITGGSDVIDEFGWIGYWSGSTGEVTVDGAGSTWTNGNRLYVGIFGSGTLNITDGGLVSVGGRTNVTHPSGSSGTIHFDNGTLTTGTLGCDFDDLTGTGTINTNGLVSDIDLVFDTTHGLNQTLNINDNPGQNITLNLVVDGSGLMGAGYSGSGTLSISDARVIESTSGYIGWNSGSRGVVTVDGTGSTWNNSGVLWVGNNSGGGGTLNITDGGDVSNAYGVIGSTSVVTVDGAGSTWTNNGRLYIAYYSGGSDVLNITNGGMVIAVSDSSNIIASAFDSTGVVTVDGTGSTWKNSSLTVGTYGSGTLNITDGGLVTVGETLRIDSLEHGDSLINMATGGMLALFGDADDSLVDFMGLIDGTDAIRYWDDSVLAWADITGATYGIDYALEYLTEGDLTGYTMLTVPEPATLLLLGLGGLALRRRE